MSTQLQSIEPIQLKQQSFYVPAGAAAHDHSSDQDLERRVTAFLADRNVPSLRRLQVVARRGVVTLRGQVASFYEKQLGSSTARRVAGVVGLVDRIEVARSTALPGQAIFSDRSPRDVARRPVVAVVVAAATAAGWDAVLRSEGAGGPTSF